MKNNRFKCLLGVIVGYICLFATACVSNSSVMTAKEFKTSMENKGLTVKDQTESASDSSYQYIYVAVDEDKYSFEYYFMKNEDSAENVYSYAVTGLKDTYEENASAVFEDNSKNLQSDFSVQAEDYYVRVIKNDNTVLYVTAYIDSVEECKTILEDLGY